MKRFFDLTFRPFFILAGAATAAVALDAFWPRWALESVEKIRFAQDYTIIVQHWGITVGLMGIFMIAAAFRADWRNPILIYSAIEKAFLVYLVIANARYPYSKGFWMPAAIDGTVVLYTIAYFGVCGFATPGRSSSASTSAALHGSL
jgi:hypothetical protein